MGIPVKNQFSLVKDVNSLWIDIEVSYQK